MTHIYEIAIVGAGPAGLSAAGKAAKLDREAGAAKPSYCLIEADKSLAKTIQRYQVGKHVMAEPGYLDLRSEFDFAAGIREDILQTWQHSLDNSKVHAFFESELVSIDGRKNAFQLHLKNGHKTMARNVVVAIGLEGNPRKLGVEGEDLPGVQYHLADPKAYKDEKILVVGAGDSAIENALGLIEQNDVWILNRRNEFARCKDRNRELLLSAINDPATRMNCYYTSSIMSVSRDDAAHPPLTVVIESPQGQHQVKCDRIIARLGAIPPRAFLESFGIEFPNTRRDAIPELSRHYESNVPGIYIIGSLAGYPLIKQAMNQGDDVVEFIRGNFVAPVDQILLRHQLWGIASINADVGRLDAAQLRDITHHTIDKTIARLQELIPMFRQLNSLAIREVLIESKISVSYPAGEEFEEAKRNMDAYRQHVKEQRERAGKGATATGPLPRVTGLLRQGERIYQRGAHGTTFFTLIDGEVTLESEVDGRVRSRKLQRGEFFGEKSLISGSPRRDTAIAGANCTLVETPRRTMLKLINTNDSVRQGIDWVFLVRELQHHFVPETPAPELMKLARRLLQRKLRAGETLFNEGDAAESLHLIRSGAATLYRKVNGKDVLVAQLRSGRLLGEMALLGERKRHESAIASVALETVEIGIEDFNRLFRNDRSQLETFKDRIAKNLHDKTRMEVQPEAASLMDFMMREGLGEATDVLLIDETLCVGCDNCEKACAATHDGINRLDRKSGPTFADIHIPGACRHCEQPHCMKDCPPNAIWRAETGQVYINESCIGCGNCATNCPYDVIEMVHPAPPRPDLLNWLRSRLGQRQGKEPGPEGGPGGDAGKKIAVKCDGCHDLPHGPACVTACPTGAARRLKITDFVDLVEQRSQ